MGPMPLMRPEPRYFSIPLADVDCVWSLSEVCESQNLIIAVDASVRAISPIRLFFSQSVPGSARSCRCAVRGVPDRDVFILSVAQIGPGPVLIAAAIFVYSRSGALRGTGLLVWAIFCVCVRRGAIPGAPVASG